MSYDYRYTQRSSTANRPGRRSFLPPPPPPGRSQQHHGLFTYWLPLLVTGSIAIGGLAAWIWSERNEHDDADHRPHDKPPRPQTGVGQPYPTQGSQPYSGPPRPPQQGPPGPPGQYPQGGPPGAQQQQQPPPFQSGQPQQGGGRPPGPPGPPPPPGGEASSYYDQSQSYRQTSESRSVEHQDDGSWYGRVSGMMKRTPSPQDFFNSASKQVGAGVAAVGGALGSIVEDQESAESDHAYGEDERVAGTARTRKQRSGERRARTEEREGFSDHERWSEEADEKQKVGVSVVEQESERRALEARERGKGRPRKAVAVVVSADTAVDIDHDDDQGYMTEHASILSHLPSQSNSSTTDLFVLIYAPGLKSLPPVNYQPAVSAGATLATTPGSELQSISPRPMPVDSPSRQFDALYAQALSLVPSPTQILPFTTKDGFVHILRHLAPGLVYISDTLSGEEGEDVAQLKGWVGHTILVAGDEGHGGLADTETETEAEDERKGGKGKKQQARRWYDNSSLVGLGKDVEVVDATRVGEDWERRIGGRE